MVNLPHGSWALFLTLIKAYAKGRTRRGLEGRALFSVFASNTASHQSVCKFRIWVELFYFQYSVCLKYFIIFLNKKRKSNKRRRCRVLIRKTFFCWETFLPSHFPLMGRSLPTPFKCFAVLVTSPSPLFIFSRWLFLVLAFTLSFCPGL
jgi:hypothetical protein